MPSSSHFTELIRPHSLQSADERLRDGPAARVATAVKTVVRTVPDTRTPRLTVPRARFAPIGAFQGRRVVASANVRTTTLFRSQSRPVSTAKTLSALWRDGERAGFGAPFTHRVPAPEVVTLELARNPRIVGSQCCYRGVLSPVPVNGAHVANEMGADTTLHQSQRLISGDSSG